MRWSAKDVERLRAMAAVRTPHAAMAAELGYSIGQIAGKLRRLRRPPQPRGDLWLANENALLREYWASHTAREIAAMLPGRTRSAVLGQAYRLGLSLPRAERLRRCAAAQPKERAPRWRPPLRAKARVTQDDPSARAAAAYLQAAAVAQRRRDSWRGPRL